MATPLHDDCPQCGGRKRARSSLCNVCALRERGHLTTARNTVTKRQWATCPRCGGRKKGNARICLTCAGGKNIPWEPSYEDAMEAQFAADGYDLSWMGRG